MVNGVSRVPVATYRLQFNRDFRFAGAEEIVGYLQTLGISDIYASPLFLAGPDSTHGYDVCQFDRINPALGSEEEFNKLSDSLRGNGMGMLLDMVPNHMGTAPANLWWNDVLKFGPHSKFAAWFDIEWETGHGKVLLPVLGDRYGTVLRRGELKLEREGSDFYITYFGKRFPVNPDSIQDYGAESLSRVNQIPGELHQIIQKQYYRLACWRLGPPEMNYRKFFDVTELVSIRVENPAVFAASHRLVFDLFNAGKITGLRIDHPDGLRDPKSYLDRLQARGNGEVYIVAEKILSGEERLPEDWAVSGTTGYDFLNILNGLFVARAAERPMSEIYEAFTKLEDNYSESACEAKRFVLENLFSSEVSALSKRLRQIASHSIDGIDFSDAEFRRAMIEYIAHFPVYRTYAREDSCELVERQAGYVRAAIRRAMERIPELRDLFVCLERILLLETKEREFIFRLQQLTGLATAKGLEDTAFYRYTRFISLNEVGGNPEKFGTTIAEFHEYNRYKAKYWPHSLLATSTHDTKRGEDLRARLNVLSEIPDEWQARVWEWRELNRSELPSATDEYLLYQTLVGSWTTAAEADLETYLQRIENYMVKAMREAKVETSWTDPNEKYENAVKLFIRRLFELSDFRRSLREFSARLGFFGYINSLSQLVLKAGSPGVPDFYQGAELWDFHLVDPDNRRCVDYELRRRLLDAVVTRRAAYSEFPARLETGEIKLFVTWALLQCRQRMRKLFESGDYQPISVQGRLSEHVVAFAREYQDSRVIVVVPRLPLTLVKGAQKLPIGRELWSGTRLDFQGSNEPYIDIFTQRALNKPREVGEILADFPVAVLVSCGPATTAA